MVYKNITNTTTFESATGYSGSDDAAVEMENDEYTFEKTADPTIWSSGEPLTYTITLTNISGEDLSDITVTDVLPTEVVFDPESVLINGESSTNFDDSNPPRIIFGTTTPLEVTTEEALVISFQVNEA